MIGWAPTFEEDKMRPSRRSLLKLLCGGTAAALVSTAIPFPAEASVVTLDEALDMIGPAGVRGLMADHLHGSVNEFWVLRYCEYAEGFAELAKEYGILSCAGLRQCARFSTVEAARFDPTTPYATRLRLHRMVSQMPGFREGAIRQPQTMLDQWGYLDMTMTMMVSLLEEAGPAVVPHVLAGTVDWPTLRRNRAA
jgi:hypothetical protein